MGSWGGSIIIINYAYPFLPPVEDTFILTEDNFHILTESDLPLQTENA